MAFYAVDFSIYCIIDKLSEQVKLLLLLLFLLPQQRWLSDVV